MNNSTSHIPIALLADFAENRMGPADDIRAHLAGCEQCASQLSWLAWAINLMRTDTAVPAPAEVVERAKQLFRPSPSQPPQRRRVTARLQFDSARRSVAFGMRSGPSKERQLLFDIEQYMIEVRVAPSGSLWTVAGQVLGSDTSGSVTLTGGGADAQAELNSASEFSLPPMPAGQYTMLFALAELNIVIPGFEIK